jgi:hypothetical protein
VNITFTFHFITATDILLQIIAEFHKVMYVNNERVSSDI